MITAEAPAKRPQPAAQPVLDLQLPPCIGVVRVEPADDFQITDDLLRDLHDQHPGFLFELSPKGELVITMPAGGESPEICNDLGGQVWIWNLDPPLGITRDSSGVYEPVPGIKYAPDVSWLSHERARVLPPRGQRGFYWPVAPEFVIEVQSPSDRRSQQEEKMEHWIELGVSVGLLVDPFDKQILVYCPGRDVETLNRPDSLEVGPELPGLTLDFTRIWAG